MAKGNYNYFHNYCLKDTNYYNLGSFITSQTTMGEVIFYEQRQVSPQGLRKGYRPSSEQICRYFFQEEYTRLFAFTPSTIPVPEPVILLYPGCGVDIITPLLYVEKLFPSVRTAFFMFNDKEYCLDLIKTILDDMGISFEEKKNALRFYWGETLVTLTFWQGDIFELLDTLPAFTVYFERAFRIMKDADLWYEQKIFKLLPAGGILISDSGFQHVTLEKLPIDQKLSAYGEMVVGIKK